MNSIKYTVYFLCLFFLMIRRPPRSTRTDTLFPYTTLFRSDVGYARAGIQGHRHPVVRAVRAGPQFDLSAIFIARARHLDGTTCCEVDLRRPGDLRERLGRDQLPVGAFDHIEKDRSDERSVGKECVSTCRSRWSQYPYKKQLISNVERRSTY